MALGAHVQRTAVERRPQANLSGSQLRFPVLAPLFALLLLAGSAAGSACRRRCRRCRRRRRRHRRRLRLHLQRRLLLRLQRQLLLLRYTNGCRAQGVDPDGWSRLHLQYLKANDNFE